MPILDLQRRVNAQADLVWSVVADLSGESALLPAISRIDMQAEPGIGVTRRIYRVDGLNWAETCSDWVVGQRYTMQVEADAFPVRFTRLSYTCTVAAVENSVLLHLYFDYQSRFGLAGQFLDRFTVLRMLQSHANQMLDNWVRIIHVWEWAHRVTVRSLLSTKGAQVHTIRPEQIIAAAVDLLKARRIGALLVLQADGAIAGVLSERDIVVGLADHGEHLLQQPVASIMTSRVIVADPAQNMLQVMGLMNEQRIRHLPVVEQGNVLGLISIGDVIKARISELEGQSATLEEYISMRRWHDLYREIGPAAYSDNILPGESGRG
jgi:CBS domain-containing protein